MISLLTAVLQLRNEKSYITSSLQINAVIIELSFLDTFFCQYNFCCLTGYFLLHVYIAVYSKSILKFELLYLFYGSWI